MHGRMLVYSRDILLYTWRSVEVLASALLKRFILVDVVPSTMDYPKHYHYDIPYDVMSVQALYQTRGRGRTGPWLSPKGGLWLSFKIPKMYGIVLDIPLFQASIALMLAYLISQRYNVKVGVVWPNDIVYWPKKLGGVLVEATKNNIIIGVGINLNNEPPLDLATSLSYITGTRIDMDEARKLTISALAYSLSIRGIPSFLLQDYDCTINKRIIVATEEGDVYGLSLGVNNQGRLVVRTSTGVKVVECCSVKALEGLAYKPLNT